MTTPNRPQPAAMARVAIYATTIVVCIVATAAVLGAEQVAVGVAAVGLAAWMTATLVQFVAAARRQPVPARVRSRGMRHRPSGPSSR